MTYQSLAAHRSMALDAVRNDAYGAALRQAVGPQSVVLDVGAGTGILGVMAARAGATRVYLVEPEDILSVAEEIVRANGLQDVVRCIQGRIEEIRLPERVDLIVSVLTGNFLLTEDLLQTLFLARDAWLKPGGTLLPSAARMRAVPVRTTGLHAKEIGAWSVPQHGVDLSPARAYAANTIFYRNDVREAGWLADPVTLCSLDFSSSRYEGIQVAAAADVTETGLCDGWAGWFDMKLGERWVSTSPRSEAMHWTPAFLPLDPPLPVKSGERVSLQLVRTPFGDWTWTMECAAGRQQHSTLLSEPMTADSLARLSLAYAPALNAEGQVLRDVLSRFDGATTVESVAAWLCERHAGRFRSRTEALRYVHRLLKPFA